MVVRGRSEVRCSRAGRDSEKGGKEMKIKVEHEVSPEKETCTHDGDFWGKSVCRYHTHRDRTHGRKAPVERHLPKCTLFDCWLEEDYKKCEACKKACEEVRE